MRIVALFDGSPEEPRALWMTRPFDLTWASVVSGPFFFDAVLLYAAGPEGDPVACAVAGPVALQGYLAGPEADAVQGV